MLERPATAALLALLLGLAARASAEPATTAASAPELRRDPRGIKGISPAGEALQRGDRALIARDFDAAIAAYREALAKDPENALAYYRIAEAQILKGELHEAETALVGGLHFVAADKPSLKAKLEFVLADLRERQKSYDNATAKWTEYETFTTAQKAAHGAPGSAVERKRVIAAWQKLSADSAQVKARSEKGVQAADEAVRKSSK